jgi:mRNA interferase RelE/StbE
VTIPEPYGYSFAPRAERQLDALPERMALVILEFVSQRLVVNPRRIGKPLGGPLAGEWSAHIGDHRVVYLIQEERRRVRVTRIGPRSKIYSP